MAHKLVHIPPLGRNIVLVPRDQLRRKKHGRTFAVPRHLKGILGSLPTPPSSFSWSKNGAVQYPLFGNDQYGDCYYAAVAHGSQTYTANSGSECSFDVNALIARYKVLSGGDNGLDDSTIMPEWKRGIVGPNGPRKILDEMTVNPSDDASTALAMWAFCGLIFTAALPDSWVANPKPGDTWTSGTPDQNNGHAMFLTGKDVSGNYELQTWGFSPCIKLTSAGLKSADPELIVAFSLDMFNAQGIAPCGMNYDQLAALWVQCGGNALPPNPFVSPPAPPIPPTPGPTPMPPTPPTPVPVPPAPPVPVPGPTIQQQIDALFATLEARFAPLPFLGSAIVSALEAVRKYIDAALSANPAMKAKFGSVDTISPEVMAIIDAAFAAVIMHNPTLAPFLKYLQSVVDAFLPLM